MVEGDSLLAVLDEHNTTANLGLLYHGTAQALETLYPRPVFWKNDGVLYPDSDGDVICATDDALVSTFMALAPRIGYPFGYSATEEGGTTFYLHPNMQHGFESGAGYIAILERERFTQFNNSMPQGYSGPVKRRGNEMRSIEPQQPLLNVKVLHADFVGLLATRPGCELEYRE
jgi:hypothetical protein